MFRDSFVNVEEPRSCAFADITVACLLEQIRKL
jgi:hypothetical protein